MERLYSVVKELLLTHLKHWKCVFYSDLMGGRQYFYLKPAAAVISARGVETTATFDQLNKYFTISQMPIISSRY
ncbi:MAG: hypothetical protein WAL81_10340 [Methanobacterium sp.]